jgi:hypothetical protein
LEPPHAVLEYTSRKDIDRLGRTTGGRVRAVDGRSAYVSLRSPVTDADGILRELEALLRAGGESDN